MQRNPPLVVALGTRDLRATEPEVTNPRAGGAGGAARLAAVSAMVFAATALLLPVAAAWLANVVFLLAGLILFWRVKT